MIDLSTISVEEKISQMLIVAYRNHEDAVRFVKNGVGGVWPIGIPKDDVNVFRNTIDELQKTAKIPLFISADFEQGAGQLISDGSCVEFPSLMSFGAISGVEAEKMAFEAGCVVAQEAAYIGVNITPAPVFDVNTVPENPISNVRSVGDDPNRVFRIAIQYVRGMESKGRLLCQGKHFPGEGMHRKDPHLDCEIMQVSEQQMKNIHLLPFREAIKAGLNMVMTNHAVYPCFDSEHPATLSKKIIHDILRVQMGFEGLIVTDAMEMHGITKMYSNQEAVIRAINAGNDLLLSPQEPQRFVGWVLKAIEEGRIDRSTIDSAVKRILLFKDKLGLFDNRYCLPAIEMSLDARQHLSDEIARKSVTLIRDRASLLPIKFNELDRVLVLEPKHPTFSFEWGLKFNIYGLAEFLPANCRNKHKTMLFSDCPTDSEIDDIFREAVKSDIVLVSTFFRSKSGQTGLLTHEQVDFFEKLSKLHGKIIFVVGNPYLVPQIPFSDTVIVTYGNNKSSLRSILQILAGEYEPQGALPVSLPDSIDSSNVKIVDHDS